LHAAQLPLQASFLAFALPGLVGAAAIMGFLWHRPGQVCTLMEKPLESTAG
jgi:AAHS family benzoate transporter-like MFS transporter